MDTYQKATNVPRCKPSHGVRLSTSARSLRVEESECGLMKGYMEVPVKGITSTTCSFRKTGTASQARRLMRSMVVATLGHSYCCR